MSHELMKLKRILPTINGKRTELLFNDDYRVPAKPSTSKSVSSTRFKKGSIEKGSPERERREEEESFHPVKETIKQLIEDKFTNIHDLLTNVYEEQKLYNTHTSPVRRPNSKAINLTIERVTHSKPAIIHSRPGTQEAGKLYGSLGRNFSQQGMNSFGVTSTTQFRAKKEFLFSLDGKKVIKIDGTNEERPLTNFTTSTRSRKYLTFSERFGPRRTPKQGAVPELIVTQYDRFMSDNPNGKPYSRRLKDPDSLYAREARRRREMAIQDNMNNMNDFGPDEGQAGLAGEGLMVNSKSATLFRSHHPLSHEHHHQGSHHHH